MNEIDTTALRSLADRDQIHDPAILTRQLCDEIDKLRRGGAQLGKTLDATLRDIVEVTDSHDLIGEDGDGDWALVHERLYALKARRAPGLPIHRTEADWPRCSTCDGGGCLDCTDPA